MVSRRKFLARTSPLIAGAAALPVQAAPISAADALATQTVSLCGEWRFRTDAADVGEKGRWYAADASDWRAVQVPHTWQVEQELTDFRAPAWYQRTFDAIPAWKSSTVLLEFEAVFHSARVWVNGNLAGEHRGKGYTAFTFDVTQWLRPGERNVVAVRVDNRFEDRMLPRGRSSDWAHDGGIFRPVQLLVMPKAYIERIDIDAIPDLSSGSAEIQIAALLRNNGPARVGGSMTLRIREESTGLIVFSADAAGKVDVAAGGRQSVSLKATVPKAKLWHFDHPHLYVARVTMTESGHAFESIFGVRKFEVRDVGFYLNGERVYLMGVERMAGSNPEFGMAEPEQWIRHDHDDLKNLNCVFTRVYWQENRRVLDYCDRHGILIQTEVPTWGGKTFEGMKNVCDADLMENGKEQLREMIARDRNHPSIFAWGLCNEIGGQNAPAYDFAKNMLAEAKRLDPNRLCSYASHSLFTNPGKDVAALMDFVECNQYYGSWQKGNEQDLAKMLDTIHREIPGKPVVISEYGYCACTADRPEGDQRRTEVLARQDVVFRERDWVAGLIFFCYNDYRTHIGDRGTGVLQQRVHGVVDVYGNRKPSYELLRTESSPVEVLKVAGDPKNMTIVLKARSRVPAYVLRGYSVRGLYFGFGSIPVEKKLVALPEIAPGQEVTIRMAFAEATPEHIQFDVLRPTGFSAFTLNWKI